MGLRFLVLITGDLDCFLLTPGDGGCGGVASRARLLSPAVFMEPSLVCFSARFWDALPPALGGGVSFLPDDIRDGLVPVEALVPGEGVEAVPVAGVPPGEALGFLEVPVMALVPGEGEAAVPVAAVPPGEALGFLEVPVEALVPGEGEAAVPVAAVPPGEALGFLEVPVMALVPGEGEVAGEVVPGEALANCFLPSGVRRRRSSSASSRAGFGLVMK